MSRRELLRMAGKEIHGTPFGHEPLRHEPLHYTLTNREVTCDKHGRPGKHADSAFVINVKAQIQPNIWSTWSFEVISSLTAKMLRRRVALLVGHRLWGGGHSESAKRCELHKRMLAEGLQLSFQAERIEHRSDITIADYKIGPNATVVVMNSPYAFLKWKKQRHKENCLTWQDGQIGGRDRPDHFINNKYAVCRLCGKANSVGRKKCSCCGRKLPVEEPKPVKKEVKKKIPVCWTCTNCNYAANPDKLMVCSICSAVRP